MNVSAQHHRLGQVDDGFVESIEHYNAFLKRVEILKSAIKK
jgi:hypothetical protein